jgi:hypothetical protein
MLLQKTCEGRFEIAVGSSISLTTMSCRPSVRAAACRSVMTGLGCRIGRVRESAEQGSIGEQKVIMTAQATRRQVRTAHGAGDLVFWWLKGNSTRHFLSDNYVQISREFGP